MARTNKFFIPSPPYDPPLHPATSLGPGPDLIYVQWDTIAAPCCDEPGEGGALIYDYEYGGIIWASFTVVPAPAAVWLFGSGLLGRIGVAKERNMRKRKGHEEIDMNAHAWRYHSRRS